MSAGHFSHLLLQLLALSVAQLTHPLLLDVDFGPLTLLVLDFEDVLLVIFAARTPHKHLVLRRRLAFAYFGENERLPLLFFWIVD